MKRFPILLVLACSLNCVTQVYAARSSTQLTRANLPEQPHFFTIQFERFKDATKGECVRFEVTVRAKSIEIPLSPRLLTELSVFDGESFVSSCGVQAVEQLGAVSYTFVVAAKYVEKSKFMFYEDFSAPNGRPAGRGYWFYLQDFVEHK